MAVVLQHHSSVQLPLNRVQQPHSFLVKSTEASLNATGSWNLVSFSFQEGQIPGKVELRERESRENQVRFAGHSPASPARLPGKMFSGLPPLHALSWDASAVSSRCAPLTSPRGFGSNRPNLPRKPMKARKSHCPQPLEDVPISPACALKF